MLCMKAVLVYVGNMANNIADKLNAINPDYNARIVTLYDALGNLEQANIKGNSTTLQKNDIKTEYNGNVKRIFINDKLYKETIIEKDKTIINKYRKGKISCKIISKGNQEEVIRI